MIETPAETLARLDKIRAQNEAAHTMVDDLDHRRREWIMSIPARPDYDPDLVISRSLGDIPALLALVEWQQELLREQGAYMKHDSPCAQGCLIDTDKETGAAIALGPCTCGLDALRQRIKEVTT